MDILSSDSRITRLADALVFPESPRWHDGALWMVDMHAHKVLRLDPKITSTGLAAGIRTRIRRLDLMYPRM